VSTTTTQLTGFLCEANVPRNWIPLNVSLRRQTTLPWDEVKDPLVTVAQLNGDGTLFVDWAGVEEIARVAPMVPGGGCEVAHLLLAMRDGRFADAPRDFTYPPVIVAKDDAP
jgi:hypothetical protein